MALAETTEAILSIPKEAIRARRITTKAPRGLLRLVPGPEALLHPRAADALVLAYRPLSQAR